MPSLCSKQQQQQQQHQLCHCTLGVCTCPRGLTHDDASDAPNDPPSVCAVDPASVSSFLPRLHPLLSKSRCVRTQQYLDAKQKVTLLLLLLLLLLMFMLPLHQNSNVPMQLLMRMSSAFECGPLSNRIQPPRLPVRAFGAEVNYLLALVHHASRANVAAAAVASDDGSDSGADTSHANSHAALEHRHTCVALPVDIPTSIYRGGWLQLPSSSGETSAHSLASAASLVPIDFWYTLDDLSPGHAFPAVASAPSHTHRRDSDVGVKQDDLGLMGHKQVLASFLLRPSRRLELLSRAAAASIGLQVGTAGFNAPQ